MMTEPKENSVNTLNQVQNKDPPVGDMETSPSSSENRETPVEHSDLQNEDQLVVAMKTSPPNGEHTEILNQLQNKDPPVKHMETSPSSSENPEKPHTSSTHPDIQPSAPPDSVMVHVKVDWIEKIPDRWNIQMQKALQSWCNSKTESEGTIKTLQILKDKVNAIMTITPSSALKDLEPATLHFKDLDKKVNGHFQVYRNLTSENVNMKDVKDPSKVLPDAEINEASATLRFPPFLYCYLSQTYKQEMENIEKKFGVKINAEACVSISDENQKKDSTSVQRATEAFTELYQTSTKKLQTVSTPTPEMKLDNMKEMLRLITNQDNKIMLNISANQWQMFGPQDIILMLNRHFSSKADAGITSSSSSSSFSLHTSTSYTDSMLSSERLHMDLKDTASKIEMNEAHWEWMRSLFEEQLLEIQKKFGVKFQNEPSQGLITVSAHIINPNQVNLEGHALNALTHLYQKVVTSEPRNHTDASYDKTSQQEIQRLPVLDGAHRIDRKPEPTNSNQKFFDEAKGDEKKDESEDICPICLDTFTKKENLCCGHEFCGNCLKSCIQSGGEICPICKEIFGILMGNQPDGSMHISKELGSLPGYPGCGLIEIHYRIPSGTQKSTHPNPGQHYQGTSRTAYLPNNTEGNHVLALLERAFKQKLIFTIGESRTSGLNNMVVWNDIHHKTEKSGGPGNYGYPDPDYLKRVKAELKSKGIE